MAASQGSIERTEPVILIVEDNRDDIELVRRAFEQAGLQAPLRFAADGDQAIAYLEGRTPFADRRKFPLPDIVLLDLKMPRKDGFDVLLWVQKQPWLATLRIVVLTTSHQLSDVNRAYRLGASSFLVKPIQFSEFKNTIHAVYSYWMMNKRPPLERPDMAAPQQPGDTRERTRT